MKNIIAIIINAWLFFSTLIISVKDLLTHEIPDDYIVGFQGTENLRFYTVDSNILMGLCALVILIFLLRKQFGKEPDYDSAFPGWLHVLTMGSAVSVAVTFVTVAGFLAPGQAIAGRGYFSLFIGNNLFFHLINPLLGCIDFLFFIPKRRYSIGKCCLGMIPTGIYAAVYVLCVVVLQVWPDFYNFTFGGHVEYAPVVVAGFLVLSFVLSVVLTRLHRIRTAGSEGSRI